VRIGQFDVLELRNLAGHVARPLLRVGEIAFVVDLDGLSGDSNLWHGRGAIE
jgi:hypothetical protein